MILNIGKFMAACLFGLIVYGCTASQLSRSGIEGYDTRPPVEERKTLLRPETRRAILQAQEAAIELQRASRVDAEELALLRQELAADARFRRDLAEAFAKMEAGELGTGEAEREAIRMMQRDPVMRETARAALSDTAP